MKTSKFISKALVIGSLVALPCVMSGCVSMLVTSAATSQVTQDQRTISTMMYDETIEQQSYEILGSNKLLSKAEDFSISITAFNGNVLITGQTINKDYLKWAESKIKKLEHVRKVYNRATLQKPVPASVVSNDTLITSKVRTQLLLGKEINSNRFKVVTENGNVYLMGIVNRDEATRAINAVRSIDGVRKTYHIFDYIEVEKSQKNAANQSEDLRVTPIKSNPNNYQDPRQVQLQRNNATSSTYVPPVQQQQNGGAYIIEDTEPMPSGGMNGGPSDLIQPAPPLVEQY